ncbi:MAG: TonB-dependent receptor [Bacteroidales bacterium]|nr:TonB-dependent receptor [Bacteroidales bacterium]
MRVSMKSVLLTVLAALVGTVSFAQVTTSVLGGKIIDETGEPVPGVAVIATHEPSGTVYGSTTNAEGQYTIPGMRTGGPYKVEVTSLGYQSVTYTDITLVLGEPYTLDAKIQSSNEQLSEAVVIAAPSSKFATIEKTGASTNINTRQMDQMPTVSRSLTDVTKLSPYGGNGMNFSGSSGRFTNFTVDGANMNNNFGLSTGLPGGGNPVSIDAIEELQVVVSPYDVRQTNFIGGGINAITKSGTNTFKGSAYVYHRNENMHGNRIDGQELAPRGKDRNTTYGFTLGGPIIKNKLFFFANFEHSIIPTVTSKWRTSADGVANEDASISRVKTSDAEALRNYLIQTYDYDPGSYDSFPSQDQKNTKILARIDWNINQNHHLALRYNYTTNTRWQNASISRDFTALNESVPSQYGILFSNSQYQQQNNVKTFTLDLNSRLTPSLSNQLLATYSRLYDVRDSNSKPFPLVEIAAGDLGEPDLPYMTFGYELFTYKNTVDNKIFTVKDDLTWYKGNHKLMGGVSFEHQFVGNTYLRNWDGSFRYDSLSSFYAGAAPVAMAFDWGYNGDTAPTASVTFNQLGLYLQDEWSVLPTFKLTAGIRFDTVMFDNSDIMTNNAIKELEYEGKHVDTGLWPRTRVQVSPRVGFSWDVLGDKSLKIRGGTGLFAGRLPFVFMTNMPTNSGMVKGRLTNAMGDNYTKLLKQFAGGLVVGDDNMSGHDKILDILNRYDSEKYPKTISPADGTKPSEVNGVDRNFKMPQVWKSSIAIDYRVPVSFPLTLTAEYIYNKTINAVLMKNWNAVQDNSGWAQFNGPDNRHIYPSETKLTGTDAYVLSNTNKGYGWIGTFSVNAQPTRFIDFTAAYTHTVSKELTAMPGSNAKSAFMYIPTVDGPNYMTLHNAYYNNPDRLMANLTISDKSGNHFSFLYEGFRYGGKTFIYNNDINGDGLQYDLMYIPKNASEIRFVTQDDADRYWQFAEQDKYLKKHAGEYADAYGTIAPWVHTVDFKYAHDFTVKVGNTRNTLRLSVDVANLLNLFNSHWGVAWSPNQTVSDSNNQIKLLNYEYTDKDGVPVFSTRVGANQKTWEHTSTYGNCWYMQIGLKYMFN